MPEDYMKNSGSESLSALPVLNQLSYTVAELFMFDTCTMRCGYCWFAESGQVLDLSQLKPFQNPVFLEKVTSFFLSRTTPGRKWRMLLTGGEPLLAPNLGRLLIPLVEAGNRLGFYTALWMGREHPGFRFLREISYPQVKYVMASFHPEAEANESEFFAKIFAKSQEGWAQSRKPGTEVP
jgi:organic radical activating enzyme